MVLLSSKRIFCCMFKAKKFGQPWNILSDTRSQRGNPGNYEQHLLCFKCTGKVPEKCSDS